ncbi:methyl-accepting chemotaxis protein [Oscillospiraceae bacterium PP1C4]
MRSIRNRIILLIIVISTLTGATQIAYNVTNLGNKFSEQIISDLVHTTEKETEVINSKFTKWAESTVFYAESIATMPEYDTELSLNLLKRLIKRDSLLVGGGFWLEPYEFMDNQKYYGPYVFRDESDILTTWDYSNEKTDYFQFDWYKAGMEGDSELTWSEPYADAVTGVTMITSTGPITKDKKVGVVTLDIGLSELRDYVSNIQIGQEGFAYLLTDKGYFIGYEKKEDLHANIQDETDPSYAQIWKGIHEGNGAMNQQIGDAYIVTVPIGDTGLTLVTSIPEKELFLAKNSAIRASIMIIVAFLIIMFIALSLFINKMIIKPLKAITKDIEQVNAGNLSHKGNMGIYQKRRDEIGVLSRSFIQMTESLKELISEIKTNAQKISESNSRIETLTQGVSTNSEQIAITMQELSTGAQKQAVNNQKSTKMLKKIYDSFESVNDELTASEKITNRAFEVMENSSLKVKEQRAKMLETQNATEKVSLAISQLANTSDKIGQIVSTMQNISRQTNLLAINATIEAARAGEMGKGFAVVAQEVKTLAGQSSSSAEEIDQLIQEIGASIILVVEEMKGSRVLVEEQEQTSKETEESFEALVKHFNEIKTCIENISQASSSLTDSSKHLVHTVETAAEATTESAAATEEVASITENNYEATKNVAVEVEQLKTIVYEFENHVNKFHVESQKSVAAIEYSTI